MAQHKVITAMKEMKKVLMEPKRKEFHMVEDKNTGKLIAIAPEGESVVDALIANRLWSEYHGIGDITMIYDWSEQREERQADRPAAFYPTA